MSNYFLLKTLLVPCILASGASAFAQSDSRVTKPVSSVDGNAGNELRSIYRQGVGQGYTAESLNSISLRNAQARIGNVGQASAGASRSSAGVSSFSPSPANKPFSSVSSSPTVSPYMNLFREDFGGASDLNYQTLVRPQLNQMQANQQFQRANTDLSQRVQAISAQSAFRNPAGSETVTPTGHQTTFGFYGRFYPGMGQQRGR